MTTPPVPGRVNQPADQTPTLTLTNVSAQPDLIVGEPVTLEITAGLASTQQTGTFITKWTLIPPSGVLVIRNAVSDGQGHFYTVSNSEELPIQATFDTASAAQQAQVSAQVMLVSGVTVQLPGAIDAFNNTANQNMGSSNQVTIPVAGNPVGTSASPAQVQVTMNRAAAIPSPTQALWTMIRQSTDALGFRRYQVFVDRILEQRLQPGQFPPGPFAPGNAPGGGNVFTPPVTGLGSSNLQWRLPFPGVEPYRQLLAATEVFVMLNCGVPFDRFMNVKTSSNGTNDGTFISPTQQWTNNFPFEAALQDEERRYGRTLTPEDIGNAWQTLLAHGGQVDGHIPTILYLALVKANLPDVRVDPFSVDLDLSPEAALELNQGAVNVMGILQQKLTNPPFLDLFWAYWMEECGLVQTMNAISWRFQNRRSGDGPDPLAGLEIDPLRPLGNFLWGYIQNEQHRLSVARRAHEYEHQFGLRLYGRAVPEGLPADRRPRFIESLHHLLHVCAAFYRQDDDTTIVADGFPVLTALKEVHLQLAAGEGNQYGDLPWTARLEMLTQQWLLARPEFREFLPRRVMVDYPEQWMHSVESMKTLQGWDTASVLHFRDLAVFGEQILLSIRYEAWPSVIESQHAANWARYFRTEIQGYLFAYRAATGVDLTEGVDATAPALLMRERAWQDRTENGRARHLENGRARHAVERDRRRQLERPVPVAQLPMATRREEAGY